MTSTPWSRCSPRTPWSACRPSPSGTRDAAAIERFLRRRLVGRGDAGWRFVPTGANRQPAYAYYLQRDGGWERAGLFVIGARDGGIESVTRFRDGGLLDRFGVPATL